MESTSRSGLHCQQWVNADKQWIRILDSNFTCLTTIIPSTSLSFGVVIEWRMLWIQVANKIEVFSWERRHLTLEIAWEGRTSWRELAVALLFLGLIRMPPGRVSSEVVRAPPAKLRPRGWPKTRLRDYISHWARGTQGPSVMMVRRRPGALRSACCHWSLTLD